MPVVDIVALVVMAAFAFHGWRSGFAASFARLAMLVVGLLAARFIGPEVALFYQGLQDAHVDNATLFGVFLTFFVVYGLGSFFLFRMVGELRDERSGSAGDNAVGAVVNGVQGLALVVLVVMGMGLRDRDAGGPPEGVVASQVGQQAVKHDFLMPIADDLAQRVADRKTIFGDAEDALEGGTR